jgi:hypothetical protein
MKAKFILYAILTTLPATAVWADMGIKIGVGTREEKLDFRSDGSDRWLAEKQKYKADFTELQVAGEYEMNVGTVFNAEYAYGRARNGRTRSNNYDDDGSLYDVGYAKTKGSTSQRLSVGAGWRFKPNAIVSITPQLGYAWMEQNYKLKHGYITFDVDGDVGPLEGLDSRYKPRLHGPWVGVQAAVKPIPQLEIGGTLKYQWLDYAAKAHWNLNTSVASLKDTGDSTGWVLGGHAAWNFTDRHAIVGGLEWSRQEISHGTERIHSTDGDPPEKLRLRDVKLQAWGANLGYRFSF